MPYLGGHELVRQTNKLKVATVFFLLEEYFSIHHSKEDNMRFDKHRNAMIITSFVYLADKFRYRKIKVVTLI